MPISFPVQCWGGGRARCVRCGDLGVHVLFFVVAIHAARFDRRSSKPVLSTAPDECTQAEGPVWILPCRLPAGSSPFTPEGTQHPSPAQSEYSWAAGEACCSAWSWSPPQTRPPRTIFATPCSTRTPTIRLLGPSKHQCDGSTYGSPKHDGQEIYGQRTDKRCMCSNPNTQRPVPLIRSSIRLPAWRSRSGWRLHPRA